MCFGLATKKRKMKHGNLKSQIPSSAILPCPALRCAGPCISDVTPGCFLKRENLFHAPSLGYWESPNKALPSNPLNVRGVPCMTDVYHPQSPTVPKPTDPPGPLEQDKGVASSLLALTGGRSQWEPGLLAPNCFIK